MDVKAKPPVSGKIAALLCVMGERSVLLARGASTFWRETFRSPKLPAAAYLGKLRIEQI